MVAATVHHCREAIAAQLFAQRGYHAVGMSDIQDAVKLGRGALYHHIRSKEDLLYDVTREYITELADSALSGIAAAEAGGGAAREQVDALMDKGRDLIDSAADLIRERPLASFGVAFAAGWIIAKLARSGDK